MLEPERRNLAWTPRWGIVRVNRRQSVAEHMYFTACYTDWIASQLNLSDAEYRNIMYFMLKHDEAECFMSDIPGPVKRRVVGNLDEVETSIHDKMFLPMPPVSDKLKAVKKLADVIDECFYLVGELTSGNKCVLDVYQGCIRRLQDECRNLANLAGVGRSWSELVYSKIRIQLDKEINCCNKVVGELVGQ